MNGSREFLEEMDNRLCRAVSMIEVAKEKTDDVISFLESGAESDERCDKLLEIIQFLRTQMRRTINEMRSESSEIESMLYEGEKSNDECVAS